MVSDCVEDWHHYFGQDVLEKVRDCRWAVWPRKNWHAKPSLFYKTIFYNQFQNQFHVSY